MSYSIRYGSDSKQERRLKQRRAGNFVGWVSVALAVLALWILGGDTLGHILFPWLDESTMGAFSVLIQQVKAGASVPAALVDFCREVIWNAFPA